LRFGNPFYSIQFGQESFSREGNPFGLKFYFYLKDAVGRHRLSEDRPVYVPEYLVSFDCLEELAAEYGLRLVEKKNFHEFYADNIDLRDNQTIFQRMVASEVEDKMTEETWAQ
jgi:mRNA (guanine-N7-)-methyltransferase